MFTISHDDLPDGVGGPTTGAWGGEDAAEYVTGEGDDDIGEDVLHVKEMTTTSLFGRHLSCRQDQLLSFEYREHLEKAPLSSLRSDFEYSMTVSVLASCLSATTECIGWQCSKPCSAVLCWH